jgi:hypothetical protein
VAEARVGEPAHLGRTINTEHTDFCPMVTTDRKHLFFSHRRGASWGTATAMTVPGRCKDPGTVRR